MSATDDEIDDARAAITTAVEHYLTLCDGIDEDQVVGDWAMVVNLNRIDPDDYSYYHNIAGMRHMNVHTVRGLFGEGLARLNATVRDVD